MYAHGAEAFRSMIQVFSHMQDGLQPNLVARYRFHTKRLRIFSCWGVVSP